MHLDNEFKALRPEVGRPSSVVVAGHRRALDAAIADGRTAPRRHLDSGQIRRLVAVAAALAVIVAGGIGWWAASRGDDVRLDTGPAGTPATSSDPTSTTQPAATVPGAAAAPAGDGGQSTATVTAPPGGGLACGPGTPIGSSLPGFLQLLPDEADAAGTSAFDAEGRLVTRRENGRFAVEALWPAPDRQLYAADAPPDSGRLIDAMGTYTSNESTDYQVFGDGAPITVLRVLINAPVDVDGPCRYVQFTVSERGATIARFAYDLGARGGAGLADREPLIIETRQVNAAPAEAVPCDGADANGTPPNEAADMQGPVAPTPAEALDAFLSTPGSTYLTSGYVEMITPDGTYTYGAPYDEKGSRWVTLVTVKAVDGGWSATHVTASGC